MKPDLLKPLITWRSLLLSLLLVLGFNSVWAQSTTAFDHVKTGFALTGSHIKQRCETCHVNGTFKGTPKDCASCHTAGARLAINNIVKTQSHFPTTVTCDTCHNSLTFIGAKFHRNTFVNSQCASCHLTAMFGLTSKPNTATHANVTGNCESCHSNTTSWQSAKPDHSMFTVATNCSVCHVAGGSASTYKLTTHIPTGLNCTSCHSTNSWKPTTWNHTQMPVTGQCSTCHNGSYPPADPMSQNHIKYQVLTGVAITNCDTCHKAGYASWFPGQFHKNVSISNQCASCHMTAIYGLTPKPSTPTHSQVTGNCESCHKTTASWAASKTDHSVFTVATNCTTCHVTGGTATPKPTNHMPSTAINCMGCHSATGAAFSPNTWSHSAAQNNNVPVTGQCATCHTGGYLSGLGLPTNGTHIPYKTLTGVAITNCDSCHKAGYASWFPGQFHKNVSISTQCSTCHLTAIYGLTPKPNTATHSQVVGNCESCHKTTVSWAASKTDHSVFTVATNCTTCHIAGGAATPKPTNHMPSTAINCMGCHSATGAAFTPNTWNHTQVVVANQCSICHTGTYLSGLGLPTNGTHIPYKLVTAAAALNCDGCHKAGYAGWFPGQFHKNVTVSSQCEVCHLTTQFGTTGKPATATHTGIVANCEQCHKSTASFLTVTFAHSTANAVGTGTCDTCHGVVGAMPPNAMGKPLTHIPYVAGVAKCDSCHKSQASFSTATMNHTVVTTSTCKSCHNGSYTSAGTQGALAMPTLHIPMAQLFNGLTLDCNACHTSTTAFTTYTMNHNGTTGAGVGYCIGCHNQGMKYLGNQQTKSLTHKSTGKPDCSTSGCHKPTGNTGSTYKNWGG